MKASGTAKMDKYANKFYGKITESAATTLTFKEIQTNVNVFDKVAWILHKLEWYPRSLDYALLIGNADEVIMALTNSNNLTSLDLANPSVIDEVKLGLHYGTVASFNDHFMPLVHDFSGLPGGGLIIAPRPLYLAIQGVSIAGATEAEVRGFFTMVDMDAADYLELVDFYRIIS